MIEISRTQDEEVGDGTTSVIILGNVMLLTLNTLLLRVQFKYCKCLVYLHVCGEAPAAQGATKRSPIPILESKRNS